MPEEIGLVSSTVILASNPKAGTADSTRAMPRSPSPRRSSARLRCGRRTGRFAKGAPSRKAPGLRSISGRLMLPIVDHALALAVARMLGDDALIDDDRLQ